MKWLQTESEHLQKLSDGEEITSIPSLSKLITDSQSYMSESTTVPLPDKVGALIPSLSLIILGKPSKDLTKEMTFFIISSCHTCN